MTYGIVIRKTADCNRPAILKKLITSAARRDEPRLNVKLSHLPWSFTLIEPTNGMFDTWHNPVDTKQGGMHAACPSIPTAAGQGIHGVSRGWSLCKGWKKRQSPLAGGLSQWCKERSWHTKPLLRVWSYHSTYRSRLTAASIWMDSRSLSW